MSEIRDQEKMQRMYEQVRAYLTRPGASKCVIDDEGCEVCVYERTNADGYTDHCAIGWLMVGHPVMDDARDLVGNVTGLFEISPRARKFFVGVPEEFLRTMQVCHDLQTCWDFDGTFLVEKFDRLLAPWGVTPPADAPVLEVREAVLA